MLFAFSKLIAWLIKPMTMLTLVFAAGVAAFLASWTRTARLFLVTGFALLLLVFQTPLGNIVIQPLEDRFPLPDLPLSATGIIVLGGSHGGKIGELRRQMTLGETSGRIVEAARLARRLPWTKLVFTGGSPRVLPDTDLGAALARDFFVWAGIGPDRILLEQDSRNTFENAVFTKRIIKPLPGETWILVTSAYHMPRSVGIFRKAGWNVIAWPSDYKTAGGGVERAIRYDSGPNARLWNLTLAINEWVGLVSYYLLGRTDALFPGPLPPDAN